MKLTMKHYTSIGCTFKLLVETGGDRDSELVGDQASFERDDSEDPESVHEVVRLSVAPIFVAPVSVALSKCVDAVGDGKTELSFFRSRRPLKVRDLVRRDLDKKRRRSNWGRA